MNSDKSSPRGLLNVTSLKLRFFLLVVLAAPAFTNIHDTVDFAVWLPAAVPGAIADSIGWIAYGAVVFSIISWTLGGSTLSKLLSVAVTLAMLLAFFRAGLPRIPILGEFFQGSKIDVNPSEAAFAQFVVMMTVIPLALFVVECFPAAEILSKMRLGIEPPSEYLILLAIWLRVYTIVLDAVGYCLLAWKEENPIFLLPRHRNDTTSVQKLTKLALWPIGAAKTWAIALVTYTIEQIPELMCQLDMSLSVSGGRYGKQKF